MTSTDRFELGVAVVGGILGGITGFFVAKKTHPVLGTLAGVAVGALAVPATVEVVKSAKP
jgi:hypothetical protein